MSRPENLMIEQLIQQDLDVRARIKQDELQRTAAHKRSGLDPNFEVFDPDNFDLLDSDTIRDRRTGESIRLGLGEGRFADAFETDYGRYERDTGRFNAHRKAYAAQFGKDEKDVSIDDLVNAGNVQKQNMIERLQSLKGQGMGFTRTGKDEYGRTLARFDNDEVLSPIAGIDGNAGLFSSFNYHNLQDILEDGRSDQLERPDRSLPRAVADQGVNLLHGTQRAVSGLAQGFVNPFINAATEGKGSETVDAFFDYFNRGADGTKELLNSEGQLARERFDKKEQAFLQPLFNIRKAEYMEADPEAPEWKATMYAVGDEAADRIEYLIENPGRILDASVESLPYMVGVGAAGRASMQNATRNLQQKFLDRLKSSGVQPRNAQGRFINRHQALSDYVGSKAYQQAVRRVGTLTGIGTVSVTEGLSNASEVYNSVRQMSEEEAQQSEQYKQLRSRGLDHREAVTKLANKAFKDTLAVTMVVAGIASAVTGAAGFESRLFTKLGSRARGAISTDNKLARAGAYLGRATGSFTGPGTREAFEEAIQSGGGEFISQVSKVNATGIGEIGPGIGAAAGEGAVVGFASGAAAGGAGTILKAAIDGGRGVSNLLGNRDTKHQTARKETPLAEPGGQVGGSTLKARTAVSEAQAPDSNTSPEELLSTALESAVNGPVLYRELETYYAAVKADPNVSTERKQALRKQVDARREEVRVEAHAAATQIVEKLSPEQIMASPEARQMLSIAKQISDFKYEGKDEQLGKFFGATSDVVTAVENAEKAIDSVTVAEDGKTKDQVIEEKMGMGIGPLGPGLRAHESTITEAINNNDEKGYADADVELAKFIQSQANKAEALKEMIDRVVNKGEDPAAVQAEVQAKYDTTVKWSPVNPKALASGFIRGGSAKLLEDVNVELAAMNAVRASLANLAEVALVGEAVTGTPAKTAKNETTDVEVTVPELTAVEDTSPSNEETTNTVENSGKVTESSPATEDPSVAEDATPAEPVEEAAAEPEAETTQAKPESSNAEEAEQAATEPTQEADDETGTHSESKAPAPTRAKQAKVRAYIEKKFKAFSEQIVFEEFNEQAPVSERETWFGRFDRTNNRVVIYTGALANRPQAFVAWVVAHELFHAGLETAFADQREELLKRASLNPDVKALAQAIAQRRGESYTPLNHVEEALVELATAHHTKSMDYIQEFYGIELPQTLRGDIGKLVRDFIQLAKKILKDVVEGQRAPTNAEVLDIIRAMQGGLESRRAAGKRDGSTPVETPNQLTEDQLNQARINSYELELLQNNQGEETLAENVTLSSTALTKWVRARMINGRTAGDVAQAAIDGMVKQHGDQVLTHPEQTAAPEEASQLLDSVDKLTAGTELDASTSTAMESSVDFLSDKMVKWLAPLVGKRKLPTSEWSTAELETTRDNLQLRFQNLGLPQSARHALRLASDKTRNLLASVPNVISILHNPVTKRALAYRLNATTGEENGFNGVLTYVKDFIQKFEEIHLGMLNDHTDPNSPYNRSGRGDNKEGIINPLREYVLQYLYDPDTGKLDENIAAIMAMEAGQWLTSTGANSLNNPDDIINDFLGLPTGSPVSPEMREAFGKGTLVSNVTTAIGRRVINQANLRFDAKNVDPLYIDALHASIGAMSIAVLSEMDLVKVFPVSAQLRAELASQGEVEPNLEDIGNANLNLIHPIPRSDVPGEPDFYRESEQNEALRKNFNSSARILGEIFSSHSPVRGPVFEAPDAPTQISRANTATPQEQRDAIEANSAHGYRPVTAAQEFLDQVEDDDFLEVILESKTDAEMERVHVRNQESEASKNNRNERSLRMVRDHLAEYGRKKFYFAQRVIRSGRMYLDSNTINPQADKFHRFVFAMTEWGVSMSTTARGKTYKNLMAAVGLGLDLDIDASTHPLNEVVAAVEARLEEQDVVDALNLLENGPGENRTTYTRKELETIAKPLASGEKPHGLMALRAVAQLRKAEAAGQKTTTIHLPMETDGKTNGVSASLLQTPTLEAFEQIKELLRATGIFFEDDNFSNYVEFAQTKGSLDLYEQAVAETIATVQKMREGEIPSLNQEPSKKRQKQLDRVQQNKAWLSAVQTNGFLTLNRSFGKTPLMVVSYGAGMGSVRRAMTNKAIEQFYEDLSAANSENEVLFVLQRMEQVNGKFGKGLQSQMRFWKQQVSQRGFEEFRLNYEMSDDTEYTFRLAHDALFGHSLQRALENKMGPVQETRQRLNEANYLANLIFTENFKRLIETQEAIKKRPLSDRERKKVLNQMIRQGMVPLVKTPLSKSQLDSLETTSSGQVIIGGDRKGRAYFNEELNVRSDGLGPLGSDGKPTTLKAEKSRSMVTALTGYAPNLNVGVSALVKLIHSSDGAVQARLMKDHAFLNVHDAQVGNFNTIDDVAKDANRAFFETHRDWNMAQEMFDSLFRLLPLIEEGDPRLSESAKVAINGYFMEYLEKYNGEAAPGSVDSWFNELREAVNDTNEARTKLFGQITHVNQFAKENTQYSPASTDSRAVGASTSEILAAAETIEDVLAIVRSEEENTWRKKRNEMITKLTSLREIKGDVFGELNHWLAAKGKGHAPSAEDVLDVLWAVFQTDFKNEAHHENFRNLISLLRPMLTQKDAETGRLRRVVVRLGGAERMGKYDAAYLPDSSTILLNENAKNPVASLLHEIVHAANTRNLENMQANDSPVFQELLTEAKDWLNKHKDAKDGEFLRVVRDMREAELAHGDLGLVAEYTAYLNTQQRENQDGSRTFVFGRSMNKSLNALARSLENEQGANVLYSSDENVDPQLFDNVQADSLNADTFADIMEKVRALESAPLEDSDRTFLKTIADRFIVPALKDMDSILIKMATTRTGARNRGKWINDPVQNEIQLEASSQNFFSSTAEMSLEEVTIHEILHAIFQHALGYEYTDIDGKKAIAAADPAIRKEALRLMDNVQAALNERHDGELWRAFLPATPSTNPALDEELARKRADHIFNNGEAGLHEFLAIGLSNPQFRRVLSTIPDSPKYPGDGTMVGWFMSMLEKVLTFLREGILNQQSPNTGKALEHLATRFVNTNAKTKALAQKKADEGWVTRKLESLNDAALRKLAELVTGRLGEWADRESKSGRELRADIEGRNAAVALVKVAKSATASGLKTDFDAFRDAFDSALSGIQKDHWLYQILTEVLPWADRNRSWIDVLRKSESLIDMVRQQKFEHTRTALYSFFDKKTLQDMTRATRENITRVILDTDIQSLMLGENGLNAGQLLNLLDSQEDMLFRIEALRNDLKDRLTDTQYNLFMNQAEGLAEMMYSGKVTVAGQGRNVHVIVKQLNRRETDREPVAGEAAVMESMEHLISLLSFMKMGQDARAEVLSIMRNEMERAVDLNGFTGLLGLAQEFRTLSQRELFDGDPTQMVKGYTSEITNAEVELKGVTDTEENARAMKAQGFTRITETYLDRDPVDLATGDPGNIVLWKRKRGIQMFSKSIMSLTGLQKSGTGMFDSHLAAAAPGTPTNLTAARVHNKLVGMRDLTYNLVEQQTQGPLAESRPQLRAAPLFNQDGDIVDFRYMMTHAMRKEHLKKREMFDEVLPRMMASIDDKKNTEVINKEAVDLMHDEWAQWRQWSRDGDPRADDQRFVVVGRNVDTKEGREMWDLLPESTKRYARQKFGGDVLILRDDTVNLVLGFRKIGWTNNKFLAPAAPVLDVAEKIWGEVMQWVRFRIAVLMPQVVIGNMISNYALLLSQGIPPQYIIRESKKAILAMRAYQKDLRARNELDLKIAALEANGKSARAERNKLARLNASLATSVVAPMVEEGMFTSIVEEFGRDENSTRRQLTGKLLDKFGGVTGSNAAVKVTSEAWMVPGSETAQLALMATQYGDFVGRFVQYNWQTKVKGRPKRQAIHDALDTFIYYNIPQNRILQFLNDNGMMMFTKFFFRIQHIVARTFARNPVQASLTLGLQNMAGGLTGSRTVEENIANYAMLQNLHRKFQFTPWDHVTNGDLLEPTLLKWIPEVFYGQ